MIDFVLERDAMGNVPYLMDLKGNSMVTASIPLEGALKMIGGRPVRISDAFKGYPVTVDGVFYFAAEVKDDGKPKPEAEAAKKRRRQAKA